MEIESYESWNRASWAAYGPTINELPRISSADIVASSYGTSIPVGQTISINWGVSSDGTVLERYLRRGANKISGTDNATTYTVTAADVGKSINAFIRYRNSANEPADGNSNWLYGVSAP